MLEARGLAFGYRGTPLGRGLDLVVKESEALCVLGPNGAGKTTLFKTLMGLIPPLDGAVLLDNRPLSDLTRGEIARALAYVPQAHATFFPFTVAEIVLMGRATRVGLFETPTAKDRVAAHAALEKLRIEHLAATPYTLISGGERQLALVARALAQEPRCLIMDEPTANLDLGNQARVLAEMAHLAASGLSVVFSTHDPDHAFRCADRVALLERGRLIATGATGAVMTPAALSGLYGIGVEIVIAQGMGRRVCLPAVGGREAQ